MKRKKRTRREFLTEVGGYAAGAAGYAALTSCSGETPFTPPDDKKPPQPPQDIALTINGKEEVQLDALGKTEIEDYIATIEGPVREITWYLENLGEHGLFEGERELGTGESISAALTLPGDHLLRADGRSKSKSTEAEFHITVQPPPSPDPDYTLLFYRTEENEAHERTTALYLMRPGFSSVRRLLGGSKLLGQRITGDPARERIAIELMPNRLTGCGRTTTDAGCCDGWNWSV